MLRKAVASDIPGILDLVRKYPDKLLPRSSSDYQELLPTTWVVEEKGLIAGCATLEVYSPKIAEIRSVAVHPDFKGKGLGAELVAAAVAEGRRLNIHEIMVVTSSPEYFRSLGFGACLNEKYALFMDGK
jgi:N-acetylglutamate synthase-like GNAT family acetyltransferase